MQPAVGEIVDPRAGKIGAADGDGSLRIIERVSDVLLSGITCCDTHNQRGGLNVLPSCGIDREARAIPVEVFRGECCEEELARLSAVVSREHPDVVVGMGGGKTIDTAKIVADRARIPAIIMPTITSTDAPCSGCAVVYFQDGTFESVCYQRTNPAVVLVDVGIIAAEPVRFLVAGMGDALSTWFEARSCERTQSANECGGYSTMAGLHIATLCYPRPSSSSRGY